jgi:hypothetical protein
MLIEFGPGDAAGTAGCDPLTFVDTMYANGYSLWEWGYQVPLEALKGTNIPAAINGEGESARLCCQRAPFRLFERTLSSFLSSLSFALLPFPHTHL